MKIYNVPKLHVRSTQIPVRNKRSNHPIRTNFLRQYLVSMKKEHRKGIRLASMNADREQVYKSKTRVHLPIRFIPFMPMLRELENLPRFYYRRTKSSQHMHIALGLWKNPNGN